jgi:hypothetical protein
MVTDRQFEREEALAVKKEEVRVGREPFKTKVESTHSEVLADLRGWVQPNKAYVLMEKREYDLVARVWRFGLFTLDVDGRPEQVEKIQYYQREKAAKILHYANFPSFNSPNGEIVKKAIAYGGEKRRDVWGLLAQFCDKEMGRREVSLDEVTELRKKVAEQAALLEAKNGKKTESKPVANEGVSTKVGGVSGTGSDQKAGA